MTDFKTVTAVVKDFGNATPYAGGRQIYCQELPGFEGLIVEEDLRAKFPSRRKIILETHGGKKYRAESFTVDWTAKDREVYVFTNVREVDEFDD